MVLMYMVIKNFIKPEKGLYFCGERVTIRTWRLLFWHIIIIAVLLLSFSGLIIYRDSFSGTLLFLFWYNNPLIWFNITDQPAEYKSVRSPPTVS